MTTRAAAVFAFAVQTLARCRPDFVAWRELNVRPSTVQQWTNGRRNFSPAILRELDSMLEAHKEREAAATARYMIADYLAGTGNAD